MTFLIIAISGGAFVVFSALMLIFGELTKMNVLLDAIRTHLARISISSMAVLILFTGTVQAQTVTVQSGVGASSNLGTRPGPVIEARLEHPWLYSRVRFSWEKKAYLDSGRIVTGDLMARFTHREVWAGAGVEVSHASTVAYEKTALRLLLGAGYNRPRWGAAVFGFAPETNTQNRSAGLRGQLDLIPWRAEKVALVFTVRPYLLRYHNGPEWERVRSGAGVDLLAGMRFGR